jgi:hypothetical protein
MTTTEAMTMMETTRDMVESTRLAIDAMQGVNQNKTAKELAVALANMLNAVAKRLDG